MVETGSSATLKIWIIRNKFSGLSDDRSVFMPRDTPKTKAQLIAELQELRDRFSLAQEQAEKDLAQERQLLRTVLDNLPVSVYIKNLQGRKTLANKVDLEIVGQPEDEVLGKTDAELFPPEVAEHFWQDDQAVLYGGKTVRDHEELSFNQSQGKLFWQLTSKLPLYDGSGEIIGLVGIGLDITERKSAEEALRSSEERYRSLIARMRDGVYRSTHAGKFVDINPAMVEMFGYGSKEEMMAIDIKTELYFDPTDRGSHILYNGQQEFDIYRMRRKDGSEIWVEDRADYVYDEYGEIIFHEGILRDVTARVRQEQSLRASEEKFRKAFTISPDSVNINRLSDGTYIAINQGFTQVMGYTEADVLGKTSLELQIWENPEDRQRLIEGLQKNGVVHNLEARFRTKDGQVKDGLMSASIIELEEEPHILSVTRDISERKLMENVVQKSRNMLHLVLDTIPQRVFWKDRNGYYLGCNMPFARSVGQEHPNQVVGKTDFELEDLPQQAEIYQEDDRVILENNRPKQHVIECIQQPDGSQQWLDSTKIPLMDETGHPFAVLGVFEDITDRKQAEEEILSRAERHRIILDTAMSGFWLADMQGRLLEVNQAYCEMSGYSAEELLSMHISDLDDLECSDDTAAHIQKITSNGHDRFETRHRRKDGTVFDVEVSVQYHSFGGGQIVAFLQNITERKQTESQLRLQSLVLAQIQDRVTVTNLDGIITYINQAELQALGYSRDELIGFSTDRYGEDAEQGATQREILEKTLRDGHWRGEVVNQTADGERIILDCRTRAVLDDKGNTIALCGISTDITETKRKEAILDAQLRLGAYAFTSSIQKFMQKVVDEAESLTESKIGFFHLVDDDGNAILLQAWSSNTLANMCTMDAANLHYPIEEAGMWAEAARDGQPHIYNDYANHPLMRELPEGHAAITRFISMPILENGKVLSILGVGNKASDYDARDVDTINQLLVNVTEIFLRKRAEDALRANEERLRLALAASSQGLYDLNLKTGETTVNEEYARMFGYEIEELHETAENWRASVHPDEREQAEASFHDYVSGAQPEYRSEFRQRTKTGEWKWILSIGKILEYDLNGNPARMLGTYTDITARKQAEERIAQHQQQLNEIHRIGRLANSTLDLETVLNLVLENVTQALNTSVGMIFLKDPHSEHLIWGASLGLSEEFISNFRKTPIRMGEGLTGSIAQTGTPIFIDVNSSNDPRIARSVIKREGLNSFVGVPIFAGEALIGVMNILTRPPAQLNERDASFCSAIGSQVGLAISNARLYAEQQKAKVMLSESEQRLSSIFDNLTDVIWSLSWPGLSIDFISPSVERWTGRRVEEFYKNPYIWREKVHPEDVHIVKDSFKEILQTGFSVLEYRIIKPDGNILWALQKARMIFDENGNPIRIDSFVSDITERKLAEEKQMEILSRLERIAAHVPGVIYQYCLRPDGTSHFPYASAGIQNVYGVLPDDVLEDATPAFDALHPDDIEQVRDSIGVSAKNLAPWHDIYRVNLPSGETIWVEGNSTPQQQPDGSILWHGYIQDVTKQQKIQAQISQLSQAVVQSPVSVVITDLNGDIEYVNPKFSEVTGYSAQEVIGQNPRVLKSGELSTDDYRELWETITSGKEWQGEFHNKKKSGELFWEHAKISAIKNEQGVITHFVAVKEDITERKQIEKELIESEQRFHAMFEMHNAVMLLIEPESGKIIDANSTARKFYGYSSEEFRQMRIEKINMLSEQEIAQYRAQAMQSSINYFIFPHRLANGEIRMVEVHSSPIPINEKTFLFSVIHDITERKQAEDALREREALLRIAGQTAQFGGWSVDLVTQKVTWSEQVALIHDKEPGYSPHLHEGIQFYTPEWLDRISRVFNACAQDGTPYDEEMEIITARERRVWVRTIGHPVRDGSGKIVGVQGSFQDISERKNSEHDLEAAYDNTLRGWSSALELREHETGGHSRRVVEITLELARKMGVEEEKIIHIQRGALLHDIGKMGIPDSILLKPAALSDEEWVTMRQHPEFAYRMLAKIDYLKPALEIPYCHHEKWDGSGYPRGLKGEEIPLAARIFAIVDAWDALSHDRPYRPAWPREIVIEHLKKQSGRQFDPQVVEKFIKLLENE
jgi:PAS domain S-box-containing protein